MKTDYDKMSWSELRAYVLEHREDLDAVRALFDRRSPDSEATWYKFPYTKEQQQQIDDVFRKRTRSRDESA
ncbi:MAG: hypothetical protein HC852_07775 [Acaryochloridaceae cyanobacterium RU_4_10]|nr:hypothetical protein [Acaryochloridaceae cyanobacterium RU_4_10]